MLYLPTELKEGTMFKKVRKITFSVGICVEKDGESYYAHCPALPGVHVDGETEEEAIKNSTIAIKLYIESLIDHGDPIPIQIVKNAEETKEVCDLPQSRSIIPCPLRQVENVLITV